MPAQRYESEELDQATLDYLHRVVRGEGRGMPGLYYDADDGKVSGPGLPVWGFVAGPVVMLLTFAMTFDSTRSPVPVALLMTAGYFLGGWLLVAATRGMIARGREGYLGYFEYVDPLYLWHGRGSAVEVEPLDMVTGSDTVGTRVLIEKTDGDIALELRTSGLADEVSDYLSAIPEAHGTNPVARGYEAKKRILAEEDEREIEAIPSPQRQYPSRGWVMPLVLIASASALFFCCKALAVAMRDSAIFEMVDKKDPGWLRLYLIDSRNTRHRAEVIAQLQRYHDEVAERFKGRKGDADVTAGLANVIRGLADHGQPLITVGFAHSDKGPGVPEGYFSEATKAGLEKHILLELHKVIQPLVKVQPTVIPFAPPSQPLDLVDVAQVFDGPAMMLVEAKVTPADKATRECKIAWTVTFQATPEGDKRVAKFESRTPQQGDDAAKAVRELYGNFANAFKERLGP